jgi:predicted HicB family RNase H-like nuclease
MNITEAKYKANKKYDSKAYKQIMLRVKKDSPVNYERIKAEAEKAGESLNQFIIKAVEARIDATKTT